MTPKTPNPPILNPRYAGATPEMLAGALLRPKDRDETPPKSEPEIEADNSDQFQSSI